MLTHRVGDVWRSHGVSLVDKAAIALPRAVDLAVRASAKWQFVLPAERSHSSWRAEPCCGTQPGGPAA
jgi:hypothetical protein